MPDKGFNQPDTTIHGTLYQAARDVVLDAVSPPWDFDTSLLVRGLEMLARSLLLLYACYRLGYERGKTQGFRERDRRE